MSSCNRHSTPGKTMGRSRSGRVQSASIDLRAREKDFFIDNLLVRIHLIIAMIRWTGLAPWAFKFPFPGSLISTFLGLATLPSYRGILAEGLRSGA